MIIKVGNRVILTASSGHTLDDLSMRGFYLGNVYTVLETLTFVTITSGIDIILVSYNSVRLAYGCEQYDQHLTPWQPDYSTKAGCVTHRLIRRIMRRYPPF